MIVNFFLYISKYYRCLIHHVLGEYHREPEVPLLIIKVKTSLYFNILQRHNTIKILILSYAAMLVIERICKAIFHLHIG